MENVFLQFNIWLRRGIGKNKINFIGIKILLLCRRKNISNAMFE